MTDIDDTLMEIAERLYTWSSDDSIDLLIQKVKNQEKYYHCCIILSPAVICNVVKLEDWRVRHVLCTGTGKTALEAKQFLLNSLMDKAKHALAVPVEEVMES